MDDGKYEQERIDTAYNIVRLLKSCSKHKDLRKGSKLYAYIREHRYLERNCYVASALVNMYARCGALAKAEQVLKDLPVRNAVIWTALIAGYVQQGHAEEALRTFESMQSEGHSPDSVTLACALKACGSIGATANGEVIHNMIASLGMLEDDVLLGNALVDMYVKCDALTKAQQVLDGLPVHNLVTWNTLIAGYVQHGQSEQALKSFDSMLHEGHLPDSVTFMFAVKACASIGAGARGEEIHDKIINLGILAKDAILGSALVDMYARCGVLAKAQQVLQELPLRDVVTWTTLISAYVQHGHAEEALECFDNMQRVGLSPDVVTFICALKACGSIGAAIRGRQIHDNVVSLGLLKKDIFIGSALVDMYARCGMLAKAQQVLKELPVRNAVMWTILIAGYTQHGLPEEALKCFDSMQCEGYSPDAVAFICALNACASIGAVAKGEKIQDEIASLGMLEKDIALGSTLIDMYACCGALAKAQQMFEELPLRNVVTWNSLIAGYVQQGQGNEALNCFDTMQHEGHSPDAVTFICALKACGSIGAVAKGERIHDKIVNLGLLEKDNVLGSILVDMYAKCGALEKAQQVFNKFPVQDVVMWTSIVAGYAQWGHAKEALKCFESMECEGHSPDAVTFISALKACGSIGAASMGEKIHAKITSLGMLEEDICLGNTLVDMYSRCGTPAKAQQVLEEIPFRNVITWNALMAGYAQHGQAEKALKCFDIMDCEGHYPDVTTIICALKACGSIGAATKGEKIYSMLIDLGVLEEDFMLRSTLVEMYAKCGLVTKAQEVLEKLPVRNVSTWNLIIAGYVEQGKYDEALICFDSMQCEGHSPDSTTFMYALKSCGSIGALAMCQKIHGKIVDLGMLENDSVLGSTLMDMYARCGVLAKAQQVLDELPVRDVVTWNALLSGYVQQGHPEEALNYFDSMQQEGHSPDSVTYTCALKACGSIGGATKGKEIHGRILDVGLLEKDVVLGSTLVDMYCKCAALEEASKVLDELPIRNVVTWNALIGGYSLQGQIWEALICFERMNFKEARPDRTAVICVLNACRHSGLLDEAEMFFSRMSMNYGITADVEHYCCMVDLFGRAGKFSKALAVIERMEGGEYFPAWLALLSACCKWGAVNIGRLVFERALHLDKHDSAAYVCMEHIYSAAGT